MVALLVHEYTDCSPWVGGGGRGMQLTEFFFLKTLPSEGDYTGSVGMSLDGIFISW